MTPPPTLPSLPSLFRQPLQEQERRRDGDAPAVPPLRRRSATETVAPPQTGETTHKRARDGDRIARERTRGDAGQSAKKSPHVLQREEREELAHEVRALEAELDALLRRAGLPTGGDKAEVEEIATENFAMDDALHECERYLGHLDSMITNELLLPAVNPISTFIHLPRAIDERRAVLRGMQFLKLRRGLDVAMSWMHHLDHTMPYLNEETFTSATGEYHYHRIQIAQFPNFKTARQLYDVYVDFLYNLEVSITEEIGQLTLREDTEAADDPSIWNQRILTVAHDVGVTEELNYVDFAQFVNYSPLTNSAMGLIVRDTVNIDDLYPYVPEERTCKDIQVACMIYELRRPGTGETVVVLKECSFAVQLVPQFPIEPRVLQQLQANTPKWPNGFMKYLHEYVVSEGGNEETKRKR